VTVELCSSTMKAGAGAGVAVGGEHCVGVGAQRDSDALREPTLRLFSDEWVVYRLAATDAIPDVRGIGRGETQR